MKIQIIVERNPLISAKSTETTKEIIEDIASMVEALSAKHPITIDKKEVEVTITERR